MSTPYSQRIIILHIMPRLQDTVFESMQATLLYDDMFHMQIFDCAEGFGQSYRFHNAWELWNDQICNCNVSDV